MNYKNIFYKKINYVFTMVNTFGMFKLPINWFDVAVEGVGVNRDRVFHIQSLLQMFQGDLTKLLTENKISLKKVQKEYIFSRC